MKMALATCLLGAAACTATPLDDSGGIDSSPDVEETGTPLDTHPPLQDTASPPDTGTPPPSVHVDPAPDCTDAGVCSCTVGDCPVVPAVTETTRIEQLPTLDVAGQVDNSVGNGMFFLLADDGRTFGGTIGTSATGTHSVDVPLFCGAQTLKMLWSNADDLTSRPTVGGYVLDVTREDCEEVDIRISLTWDDRGDDFELHLVRPGGRNQHHRRLHLDDLHLHLARLGRSRRSHRRPQQGRRQYRGIRAREHRPSPDPRPGPTP